MSTQIDALFNHLWQDYVSITPSAEQVHRLLKQNTLCDTLINDHVAFRTFALDKTRLNKLAVHFEALGYRAMGEYDFAAKKLSAKHFQHDDLTQPKIFISELRVEELSAQAQTIIQQLVAQMPEDITQKDSFLYSGPHWEITQADYDSLLAESEYAAWLAAWGFRANHFTVSVNHLGPQFTLKHINTMLKQAGFVLNAAGGEIKGGKEVCLAQSSIMADKMPVTFLDAERSVPSCFYEFAERFAMQDGQLYQGFVAASADKIFESTHTS